MHAGALATASGNVPSDYSAVNLAEQWDLSSAVFYLAQTQARASRAAASCTDEEADPCTTRGGGVLWGGGRKRPRPLRTKQK